MNKITKGDIIEAVTFILMTVGIITIMCLLYEVKELRELTKSVNNFRSIK
jgi:hypothetical protein